MKNKVVYSLFQATYGIVMNVIGFIVFIILTLAGNKPERFGNTVFVRVGHNWGGVTLGCFIFVCDNAVYSLVRHEYGHTYQNIIFGPLFPFLVGIPSAIRYWYREYLVRAKKKKYKDLPDYESIWFEGQATKLGKKYTESI